jgi:aminopeptidase N
MNRWRLIAALSISILMPLHAQDSSSAFGRLQQNEMDRYASFAQYLRLAADLKPVIDVKYYKLNIRIADQQDFLSGEITALAIVVESPLSAVTYNLTSSLTVDSVLVDGITASFTTDSSLLRITPPRTYRAGDTITTRVFYHGFPPYTGLGSYTDTIRPGGARWIYTLSEPYGARDWWPCIDHPDDKADSADIWLTCGKNLLAVTNGMLIETVTNADGTTTFKWKHRYPIASYLISATIGNFDKFSDWYVYAPGDSMEVVNYVLPTISQTSPNYRANAALVPKMLAVYGSLFGQYPFIREKYGHAEFGWSGGMEHQTLTSLGPQSFDESTMAHELAHQWFGDMITCRTWGDLWLNEGFAQYFEAVWEGSAHGDAAYASLMASRAQSAKGASGTLYVQDTANVDNLFSGNRVYNKGAWVLHMLRHAVGDSLFFASIRAYANDPTLRYGTASTADLRRAFETVTGRDMGWFFNEWVFGTGYPKYSYSLTASPEGAAFRTQVRIKQTAGTATPSFFVMPIDLKFTASGWDTTVTVMNDAADETFQFAVSHKPDSLQFDPQLWILRDASRVTGSSIAAADAPLQYSLSQNYPNPFNPSTVIEFSLAERSLVSIGIYDVIGREAAVLFNGEKAAGAYSLPLDAHALSSGVYFCRMIASHGTSVFTATRKLLLVR